MHGEQQEQPLSPDLKPVKAGMKSNAYNPLTEAGERSEFILAALDALETIGLGDVLRKRCEKYGEGWRNFWG